MSGPEITGPLPGSAEVDGGRLRRVGGVDVDALVAAHGTPLYVLDRDELVGRMRTYRAAFGDGTIITYAAKALCVAAVLQLADAEGLHVDVASAGELATALLAGVPGARLVLHGNNKSAEELRAALAAGVGRIVVDSDDELDRLLPLAAGRDAPVDVWIRVAPGVGAGGHAFIRTGQDDTKFGFPASTGQAEAAIRRVGAEPSLRLRGLHCHVGSQVLDGRAYGAAAAAMVRLLARARDLLGAELEELDLGGGLGIAYASDEPQPDVLTYASALRDEVARACAEEHLAVPRLVVEPGRSVVGPAGLTLYRVGTVKDIPGVRRYVAVDGGMSDNLRPALYDARYAFWPAGEGPAVTVRLATAVVGKHCETGDLLGRDVPLPDEVAPGDLLAVAATGAYGHAMASNYNRLPRPAMVLVGDGAATEVVRRETVDEVLARDVLLDLG